MQSTKGTRFQIVVLYSSMLSLAQHRRNTQLYSGYPSREPRRTEEFLCQQKGRLSSLLSSPLHKHIMRCQKKKKKEKEMKGKWISSSLQER